ncbi:hypothetical protein B0I35DRAFT_444049 [Stachybotrys elegans]|uniref:Uncharacterized protein n=1 Tax=Stachybotrys elegans TaxID=80388 RepID=A0A8K0SE49_9HYPO|nr:hypothetical protein B0I35DRAFT_444049 [Stachybotrys elegans]
MTSRYAAAHVKPKGPGDARPTALQIVEDENRRDGLVGKVALITGCSSGIGIETARALKATGATLFLTARNLEKARAALGDILTGDKVHLLALDLESLDSVRACVEALKKQTTTLNILITNAGIRHVPLGRTKDGFERHWGTNHVSHFLLFELLKPMLIASSTPDFQSRVVAVSSTAHRNGPMDLDDLNWESRRYDYRLAYGQSKLANLYMATEIEKRYGSQGLHAWAVHPGGIRTGLQHFNWSDTFMVVRNGVMNSLNLSASPEQGASTTVWAAVSRELEGKGGKYLEKNRVSEPARKGHGDLEPGHASWAYDDGTAKALYDKSLQLVGM